ncbi:MAG: AmmeMemoRadiSam system radical SAM enzyme [Spirochaetota bacterium]
MWYRKNGDALVCTLCPHGCRLSDGQEGMCLVRINKDNTLTTINYGRITSASVDPVEKKPLYHFYPGSPIFSIGTFGCNMRCPYCQNWQISQRTMHAPYHSPDDIIRMAKDKGCELIAYTYSEPVVWYEYVYDCAQKAHDAGLKNVIVTNGYINRKPFETLLPHVDACNIDLKTFNDKTYAETQQGRLKPVLNSIEMAAANTHVEVTTLVVTGMNDTMKELTAAADWIASVDPSIPWHLSRYFPAYNYDEAATDTQFLLDVCTMAKSRLRHVYCGNMGGRADLHNSYCPDCGSELINRQGYNTDVTGIQNGKCVSCGTPFDGIVKQ